MAKKTDYNNKLQGFSERLKTEPVQLTVQKVTPTEVITASKEEKQLNVWIHKDLLKQLKIKAAESDKSLKEMVVTALEQFLQS